MADGETQPFSKTGTSPDSSPQAITPVKPFILVNDQYFFVTVREYD
jgi:hypothetical protein